MPEYQVNLQAKLHSTNAYVSAALNEITIAVHGFSENLGPVEPASGRKGPTNGPTRFACFPRQRVHFESFAKMSVPRYILLPVPLSF